MNNGLSHYSINALYQDEHGFVWIGTRDGLNRYDGNEITVYKQIIGDSTALFGNNIRSLCGNKKGNLFMKCKSGVILFDLKTEMFTTIRRTGISSISYGNDRLLFCSSDSIYTYNSSGRPKVQLHLTLGNNSTQITAIHETKNQLMYIATNTEGLLLYDKNKKLVKKYDIHNVISLYEDSKKNIWVCTRFSGLYKIDFSGDFIVYAHNPDNEQSIPDNFARTICEDDFGNYWIGLYTGLCKLNPDNGKFTQYRYEKHISHGLSNSSVWSIMKDAHGTLWIGTYFGGIDLFNPRYSIFSYYGAYENTPNSLSNPVVGRIVEDKYGNLWIGTDGGGVNYYNREKEIFTSFQTSEKKNSLSANTIKSLWIDEEHGNLWIGTHLGGLNKLNLKTKEITRFMHDPSNKNSIPNNNIREIIHRNDTLFLATHNFIGVFNLKTEKCVTLDSIGDFKLNNRELTDLLIDSKNRVWFTYSDNIFCTDLKISGLKTYKSENNALVFHEDSKGDVRIGTDGGGIYIYNEEENAFEPDEKLNKHLQSEYVIDIKQSQGGYFYISTNAGLAIVDNDFNYSQLLNSQMGFPLQALNENSIHISDKSEVFVGGINGMVSFHEKDLNIPREDYSVNITGIEVNNHKIRPGKKSIIEVALPYLDQIVLKPQHSVITILFSTTNYINVLKSDVQYQLAGFDKDWIDANFQQHITYTNLNAGEYTLKIRGKAPTAGGIFPEKEIIITVLPPFYKTTMAYVIYGIILFIIAVTLIRFYTSKIQLRTSLEYEKREKAHIEELNQSKLRFFTNISHEFRTPLTLIINQVEIMLQMGNIPQSIYGRLLNVMRNANLMKKLVTELIDFRKYEQGYMQLKVSEHNLIPFLNEVYLSFKELAQSREISYTFEYKNADIKLWFDANQMEKVFFNLFANAFKYTPAKGNITVRIEEVGLSVIVSVIDDGVGIDRNELNKIFDRFYQAENSSVEWTTRQGSGIGLALAKGIVDLHHGEIGVESELNVGSRFWVKLPVGDSYFTEEQKIAPYNNDLDCLSDNNIPDKEFIADIVQSQEKSDALNSTILIIEDNEELLDLLSGIFQTIYKVITAKDGMEGFEKAVEHQPDIILSDVMMPRMSGVEMTSKLKSNLETSHIPIVLLTAQTAADFVIQGLLTGADDYIVKPFNLKVLVTRCNNLVNSRKLLQKKFALQPDVEPQLIATNSIDQRLLEKATGIVEKNIDNPQFDINMFASEMWLSRTNLFNKIKGITGQTPNDFIINIRLKKSLYYLTNSTETSIGDIAIQVGFNSTSYFIKKFHKLYGVTPSQYRKERYNELKSGNINRKNNL